MSLMAIALIVATVLIIGLIIWERWGWRWRNEGFTTLTDIIRQAAPRRYDVTYENELSEEPGYLRDRRFWSGYADVQRLGVANDFCRMIERRGRPTEKFFACALAGTENLDSYTFSTPTVAEGLQMSRDDYMSQPGIVSPGAAYCRILKRPEDGSWQAMCNPVDEVGFQSTLIQDNSPPDAIKRLLRFYRGILIWFRFQDDLLDYAANVHAYTNGGIAIDETPSRRDTPPANGQPETEGLLFDGMEDFLRLGENPQLQLGINVPLLSARAFCFWVRFDKFTNWAHIFDFGDGGNKNTIWMGIEMRGNPVIDTAGDEQPPAQTGPLLATQTNEVCRPPPQAPEVTPQELLYGSEANIDAYACPLPDSAADEPSLAGGGANKQNAAVPPTANFIFEIWDSQQRKQRVRIENFFILGKWTHVCCTATSADAQRPDWNVYKNGILTYTQRDGFLAQSNLTSHNYIGRSNDEDPASQWADRTERFKGRLYDFRVYQAPLTGDFVEDVVDWGREALLPRAVYQKLYAGSKEDKINTPDANWS